MPIPGVPAAIDELDPIPRVNFARRSLQFPPERVVEALRAESRSLQSMHVFLFKVLKDLELENACLTGIKRAVADGGATSLSTLRKNAAQAGPSRHHLASGASSGTEAQLATLPWARTSEAQHPDPGFRGPQQSSKPASAPAGNKARNAKRARTQSQGQEAAPKRAKRPVRSEGRTTDACGHRMRSLSTRQTDGTDVDDPEATDVALHGLGQLDELLQLGCLDAEQAGVGAAAASEHHREELDSALTDVLLRQIVGEAHEAQVDCDDSNGVGDVCDDGGDVCDDLGDDDAEHALALEQLDLVADILKSGP